MDCNNADGCQLFLCEVQKLAAELVEFACEHDFYEYMDSCSDREEEQRQIEEAILSGNCDRIVSYFLSILEEDADEEIRDKVESYVLQIISLCQAKMPGLVYKTIYGEETLWLTVQQYVNNGCIYIGANCSVDGNMMPYAPITVNLPGSVPPYHGYLDINNLPGIDSFIEKNGIGRFTGVSKVSGMVTYPLYLFHKEKLMELCPDDVIRYEQNMSSSKRSANIRDMQGKCHERHALLKSISEQRPLLTVKEFLRGTKNKYIINITRDTNENPVFEGTYADLKRFRKDLLGERVCSHDVVPMADGSLEIGIMI